MRTFAGMAFLFGYVVEIMDGSAVELRHRRNSHVFLNITVNLPTNEGAKIVDHAGEKFKVGDETGVVLVAIASAAVDDHDRLSVEPNCLKCPRAATVVANIGDGLDDHTTLFFGGVVIEFVPFNIVL